MEQQEKKTRNNKKWFVIVAMLLLLVAILALGGYTFARYISSTSVPAQSATVAKWGFVVNASADDLFSEQYSKGTKVAADATGVTVDVKKAADNTADGGIVAPGTKGKMTFSVVGQAEVMAQIKLDFTVTSDISITITDGSEVYKPIKWTLQRKQNAETEFTDVTGAVGVDLATLKTKLESLYSGKIAPNATAISDYYELSWEWAFQKNPKPETGDLTDEQKAENAKYDAADTALGIAADGKTLPDGYSDAKTTIEFAFALSVEQVQAD